MADMSPVDRGPSDAANSFKFSKAFTTENTENTEVLCLANVRDINRNKNKFRFSVFSVVKKPCCGRHERRARRGFSGSCAMGRAAMRDV
jgi:hypothetical protein